MSRPKYPDDFSPLPVAHLSARQINNMVQTIPDGDYFYLGDTLVLNSAGQVLVFALVAQAPAEVKG